MADDKSRTDGRDRSRVAGNEDYEVRYFAERHGITPDQVRELMAEHGNDRDVLEDAAKKLTRTA